VRKKVFSQGQPGGELGSSYPLKKS